MTELPSKPEPGGAPAAAAPAAAAPAARTHAAASAAAARAVHGAVAGRRHGRLLAFSVGAVLGLVALIVVAVAAGLWTGVIVIPPQNRPAVAAVQPAAPAQPAAAQVQQVAEQQPAAAETNIVSQQNFDDWLYTCVQVPQSEAVSCSIMQRLVDSQSGGAALIWRIAQAGNGGLVAIWQTPEAVSLSQGLLLDAGTPQPIVVPYERCGNGRCEAIANLAPDFLETLSTTEKITVGLVSSGGQRFGLSVSPRGLRAGLEALRGTEAEASAAPSEPSAAE
jgi:invasion protein IalB